MPSLLGMIPSCPGKRRQGRNARLYKQIGGSNATVEVTENGVTIHRDLEYVTNGHALQKLDLHLPAGGGTNLPVLIFIHGGGFQAGDKAVFLRMPHEEYLADGYAVASFNFRLVPEFIFPAQLQDCKSAIRYLRAHASELNIDPNRICAYGGSSGGYLASMIGACNSTKEYDVGENLEFSSEVQCVVNFSGSSNFLVMDSQRYPGGEYHDIALSAESMYVGGPLQEMRGECIKASPLTYITSKTCPFLVCHGDADLSIPYQQSLDLVAALQAANVYVSFHTVPGAGHDPFDTDPCVKGLSKAFLAQYLKRE